MQRKKGLIVADGWPILLVLSMITLATVGWGGWKTGFIPLLLVLFTLFFFRNPPRRYLQRMMKLFLLPMV